jgi:hypothetical protein
MNAGISFVVVSLFQSEPNVHKSRIGMREWSREWSMEGWMELCVCVCEMLVNAPLHFA